MIRWPVTSPWLFRRPTSSCSSIPPCNCKPQQKAFVTQKPRHCLDACKRLATQSRRVSLLSSNRPSKEVCSCISGIRLQPLGCFRLLCEQALAGQGRGLRHRNICWLKCGPAPGQSTGSGRQRGAERGAGDRADQRPGWGATARPCHAAAAGAFPVPPGRQLPCPRRACGSWCLQSPHGGQHAAPTLHHVQVRKPWPVSVHLERLAQFQMLEGSRCHDTDSAAHASRSKWQGKLSQAACIPGVRPPTSSFRRRPASKPA